MATDHRTLDELADALVAGRPPMRRLEHRTALTLYRLLAEGAPVSDARLAAAVGLSDRETRETLAAWPAAFRDAVPGARRRRATLGDHDGRHSASTVVNRPGFGRGSMCWISHAALG